MIVQCSEVFEMCNTCSSGSHKMSCKRSTELIAAEALHSFWGCKIQL